MVLVSISLTFFVVVFFACTLSFVVVVVVYLHVIQPIIKIKTAIVSAKRKRKRINIYVLFPAEIINFILSYKAREREKEGERVRKRRKVKGFFLSSNASQLKFSVYIAPNITPPFACLTLALLLFFFISCLFASLVRFLLFFSFLYILFII